MFNYHLKKDLLKKAFITDIPVNADEKRPKGFLYLATTHTSTEDNTMCEFGLVRLGYSGNHVTKSVIHKINTSENGIVDFSVDSNGQYVQVSPVGVISVKLLIWG